MPTNIIVLKKKLKKKKDESTNNSITIVIHLYFIRNKLHSEFNFSNTN